MRLCCGRFGAAADAAEPALELASEELRCAAAALGRVTGAAIGAEAVLDALFAEFCIGK